MLTQQFGYQYEDDTTAVCCRLQSHGNHTTQGACLAYGPQKACRQLQLQQHRSVMHTAGRSACVYAAALHNHAQHAHLVASSCLMGACMLLHAEPFHTSTLSY